MDDLSPKCWPLPARVLLVVHGYVTSWKEISITAGKSSQCMQQATCDTGTMAKDVESDIEVVRHDGNKDVASSASSNDLDDTYNLYKQQNMDNVDPQEASRVLRRIDYHILPILMMTYMLQYLDKSSINFASVHGLRQGTNLKGQDYSWLGSIFYFGYLVAQYPAGYALQRLPLGKFIGAMILAWGILIITTPACTSFAVIATNRFLLGVFEAVVNPGFVLVMAMWD